MLMEIIPQENTTQNGPDTLNEVINTDAIKQVCVCVCACLALNASFFKDPIKSELDGF